MKIDFSVRADPTTKGTTADAGVIPDMRLDLENLASEHSSLPVNPGQIEDRLLAQLACFLWASRRDRTRVFDADIFGEPAWDMLLDLFRLQVDKRQVFVKSACISANAPNTTALRWISVMTAKGWLRRIADADDKRRQSIVLTESGMALVRRYLLDIYHQMEQFRTGDFANTSTITAAT